jgi:hypothetical protein
MDALHQGICQTEIAIAEVKERENEQLFETFLIVGSCIFATWAAHAAIASMGGDIVSHGVLFTPRAGGAGITVFASPF